MFTKELCKYPNTSIPILSSTAACLWLPRKKTSFPLKENRTSATEEAILEVLKNFGVPRHEAIFVCDTKYDMEHALDAGVLPVGMARGLATKGELLRAGARHYVNDLYDLMEFVLCLP